LLVIPRVLWILPAAVGAIAGYTDYRWRRIPNWLTVPSFFLGIALNSVALGWTGAKYSLLGAGLGLLILFPFVLLRSLGAGDWKLIGALGAFLGPHNLITLLFVTVLIAGLMALIVVIWKRRFVQTARNIGRMLAAMMTLHIPGKEVSLDNPESSKIPFGVAAAISMVLFAVSQLWNGR